MNIDLKIAQIKNKIRYNNISFDYFVECFHLLDSMTKVKNYKGTLSFARTLKEAAILLDSRNEQILYFRYFDKINEIIENLENEMQNKVVKIK